MEKFEHVTEIMAKEPLDFVFFDEIEISRDSQALEGYVWATDSLVDRLKAQEPPLEEDQFMENINFYPVYNLNTGSISMEGHYYLEDTDYARGRSFTLPLTIDESNRLRDAFEAYCWKRERKSCLAFLKDTTYQKLNSQINVCYNESLKFECVTIEGRKKEMKKYYVTLANGQHRAGVVDEDYILKTDDADEAIKEARYFASRTSAKVEIRMYKEDMEDENIDCFDYDTLDFQEEEDVPERIQDIESSAAALYDGGWRKEDKDQLIAEFDLHPDDADAICEKLAEYEAKDDK